MQRPLTAPEAVQLPQGWRWGRLSEHFRHIDERSTTGSELLLSITKSKGVVPRHRITDRPARADTLVGYKKCRAGDFIVNQMSAFDGLMGVTSWDGIVTYHYLVFRPVGQIDTRFMAYLLRSPAYMHDFACRVRGLGDSSQKGVRTPHIRIGDMLQTMLALPPQTTQRAIADYLDAETARIDALIAKKRRLIEVLGERYRTLLVRLVLGDSGQPGDSSPSGIYRVVPDGWQETALRHLGCEVQTGPFGSQLHAEEYVEGGWPVVNPLNLVGGGIRAVDDMTITDQKRQELQRHVLRAGDIVFGRRGEMGRAGLVEERHSGWLCGTGSLRLRLGGERLSPQYLVLLLGTAAARAYFELSSVGSTMDNLNSGILLAFPSLLPPRDEQDRIVGAVAEAESFRRRTTDRLTEQINLLDEHRQALITAAVTGELEVV